MAGMDTTEPAIVLDSLNAHAAVLGLAPLERPYSVEEAIETAGPDGVLVAVVEIPLSEMFTAHDREEDGERGCPASSPSGAWMSWRRSAPPERLERALLTG